MFPNPLTTNNLSIENNGEFQLNHIAFYDMKGSMVYEQNVDIGQGNALSNVSLLYLSSGMDIILLSDKNGNIYWNKTIKK